MNKEQGESAESPWLLVFERFGWELVYYSPTQSHPTFRDHSRIELNKWICSYNYGWLLIDDGCLRIAKYGPRFMLFNPKTQQIIPLPDLPLEPPRQAFNASILWLPPHENPRSKVFLLNERRSTIVYCNIHENKWIEVSYRTEAQKIVKDRGDACLTISCPVNCNGRLYALLTFSKGFKVVEFDIVEGTGTHHLEIKPLESDLPVNVNNPDSSILKNYKWWLAESQGELFAISMVCGLECARAIDVRVFGWDFNSAAQGRRNVKGSEIKDRAFFLVNRIQPLSCTTTGQEFEGGRVYYTRAIAGLLYSYDVEEGSVTVTVYLNSRQSSGPSVWVMAPNPREDREEMTKKKITSATSFSECKRLINFLDVPYDIIETIAKKIRPVDCKNLRATCKTCCQLTPPIRWRTTSSLVQVQPHSLPPWLMFSRGDHTMHHFIDMKFGGTFTVEADELLCGAKIRHSKNGWVLLANTHDNLFFYDPFTKEVIQIPDALEHAAAYDSFCFTDIPSSPKCIVLGFTSHLVCYFDMRQQQRWSFIRLHEPTFSIDNTPIFFEGAFYALSLPGNFYKLKFENGHLIESLKYRCPGSSSYYHNFLLEWEGKLVAVFINPKLTSLEVFITNETTSAWEGVRSLGKSSFFLSRFSAFSINTDIPELENKIYLSNTYEEDKIIFYCLKTKRFGYTTSQETINGVEGTKKYLSSCWIQLSRLTSR